MTSTEIFVQAVNFGLRRVLYEAAFKIRLAIASKYKRNNDASDNFRKITVSLVHRCATRITNLLRRFDLFRYRVFEYEVDACSREENAMAALENRFNFPSEGPANFSDPKQENFGSDQARAEVLAGAV
jgi:hypothetical protein